MKALSKRKEEGYYCFGLINVIDSLPLLYSNAKYDKRLKDLIAIVYKKRTITGRWRLQNRHAGKTFFEMEQVGSDSRWNTLRALRVLKWWEGVSRSA